MSHWKQGESVSRMRKACIVSIWSENQRRWFGGVWPLVAEVSPHPVLSRADGPTAVMRVCNLMLNLVYDMLPNVEVNGGTFELTDDP